MRAAGKRATVARMNTPATQGLENWDEVRTAWQVARLGTVSAAAEVLGVHHATVIRHIDALERQIGTRLFQRHAKGYTPTEAGRDLLAVADRAADQFAQLAARLRDLGSELSGDLVVTTIAGIAEDIVPSLARFRAAHPRLRIRLLTDARLYRLEYGEAHVAIRAGARPEAPDNVVLPLAALPTGLWAARAYAEAQGLPRDEGDLGRHRFVGFEGEVERAPHQRWLAATVPPEAVVFRASDPAAVLAAVRAGVGLGFVADPVAARCADLVQAMPSRPDWAAPLWLVTHVDLHRTPKVQALVQHLREAGAAWARG